jgi:signal transduction histidine kinase
MLQDRGYRKGAQWCDEAGKTLEDSGRQLLMLINDILQLAKAEAGKIEVNLANTSLPEVVKGLRRTIEGLARGSGVKVAVDVPQDLPRVRADRARLREIILNLVDNAVKYTPAGGRVELSAATRNGHAHVSVSDTGVGIPSEAGDRIFEPFYRVEGTKALRGQASSGLGLALTKRLVEAQAGEITFVSTPDVGTTFTFTVPLARASGDRRR